MRARLRPRLGPRSLRGQLTLANVVMLAAGLLVTASASILGLRSFLIGQMDGELAAARAVLEERVSSVPVADTQLLLSRVTPPTEYTAEVVTPDGKVITVARAVGQTSAAPQTPLITPRLHNIDELAATGRAVTVDTDAGSYRARVGRLADGRLVVIGASLRPIRSNVQRLLLIEGVASLTLLVILTLVALGVLRRELRPLEDMVDTASAIARGNLSRRVTGQAGGTEVRRLRSSLNAMLTRIENAFRVREQATRRLRQFVADASHELRTPLSAIRGYLQLYQRGMLPDDALPHALDRAASEADRMSRLTDDLFILARLDHEPELPPRPVELTHLVADAVTDLQAQQPARHIQTTLSPHAIVDGVESHLRQVIGNLLSNIRAHTPPDATVTLTLTTVDGYALLRVADQGPGMQREAAARVFDRFFRANPDRARLTGGSGLGMSIVNAIVTAHNGTVDLDTSPGRGTTVTIRLPLRPVSATTRPNERTSSRQELDHDVDRMQQNPRPR